MTWTEFIGRLLGLERTVEIGRRELSLSAPWAHDTPAWLLFGCLALAAVAVLFYTRYQYAKRAKVRFFLAILRAALLSLLLVILAEPVLTIRITSQLRPSLWLLFDGTDSMGIADDLPEGERAKLAEAVGLPAEQAAAAASADPSGRLSRTDYVKVLLEKKTDNLVTRLQEKFRLKAFLFDRPDGVQGLEADSGGDGRIDAKRIADQLTTKGQVTALGAALGDLARRHATSNLAGVVVFSDFNWNSGPPPIEEAKRLGLNVYTVGVGPVIQTDLAVDLQCPPQMKKDERYPLTATVRQEGLTGRRATVKFSMRQRAGNDDAQRWRRLEEREIGLDAPVQTVEVTHVPGEVGKFVFAAEVEPFPEEVVTQNNRAESETVVHDNVMRLLFVEYEPTWEWKFIKEVFHRDKLVGPRGFRTFLRSADPKVRQTNELYVHTLSPPRSEFFQHDVILLSDMPASALSPRFCEMTEEFVDKLGGGLVVLAGPRFGPGQLSLTPLGDMLPVKVDPNLHIRDRRDFTLLRTAQAAAYDFMQIEGSGAENEKAWANLGKLPWYQPVVRLQTGAEALAVHPTDKCIDGKDPQPIIARRQYGKGEVIYIGFDEMWRLRRGQGERYYREFWGQLIHRLASRHALGAQKRFVVRTDRPQYQAGDNVFLTVEARDENYRPLREDKVPGHKLSAELFQPQSGAPDQFKVQPISVPQLREGIFEIRFPVFAGGEHRVKVRDPIAQKDAETTFQVTSVSVERERAIRNNDLQKAIADATGGKSYDLSTVSRLADEVRLTSKTETNVEVIPLWNTWLAFGLVALLMLGEWFGRKWVNLP